VSTTVFLFFLGGSKKDNRVRQTGSLYYWLLCRPDLVAF